MTKMPKLLYGTAWKKEATTQLVEMAILTGFRGIDTACQPKHYEEHLVGEAIAHLEKQGISREELFIQTKFTPINGQDPKKVPYNPNNSIELQIQDSFEVSKKNLRVDYIDSYILHSPLFPYENLIKAWRAMEEIYERGEAKQLGISNCYDLELLKELYFDAKIKPAVVQNRFYAQSSYDTELRQWCDTHNIFYQSFWSLSANPEILNSHLVNSLAKKYDRTNAQIFYRYLIHVGITPLIGSTSKEHLVQDLNIFEFILELKEIDDISKILESSK